jgi:hypothetical protein
MIFIGLGGLAGSGKTTIAKHIHLIASMEKLQPITISFATPLKKMVFTLLTVDGYDHFTAEAMLDMKTTSLPNYGGKTMRHILQTLGTEWGRDLISPTLWTDIALRTAKRSEADVVVFDDVRFETEDTMIHAQGGKVIVLRRGEDAPMTHRSESMDYAYDQIFENEGDPMEVARAVWGFVRDKG